MRVILLAVILLAGDAAPVLSACYDMVGCTDRKRFRTSDLRRADCEKLWLMRTSILAENGYCFDDARAAEFYGDAKCVVTDITKLPLNPTERSNFKTIAKVESEKGC